MPTDHLLERCSFRDFELDVPAYELRRDKSAIRLERQPMDLLILLVERRGELVTRSDIVARLWTKDVFVDVDMGINTAIRKIRAALGDSPDAPAFVETVPGKGYRFVAAVEIAPSAAKGRSRPRLRPSLNLGLPGVAVLAGLATLVAVSTVWLRSTPAPPRVTGYTQITSDLVTKFGPVTDGARLYFNELPRAGVSVLAQVAASGGDVTRMDTPFPAPEVWDVSPDGSELLVLGQREPFKGALPTAELWIVPLVGGTPRRVGDLRAHEAAWSSDGRNIAFTTGSEDVYLARSDGSDSRRIWRAPGTARWPALSRDGRTLRVTVFPKSSPPSLWEIGADGQGPHPLLAGFESPACCGRWTSDGKYFIFDAYDAKHGSPDIWVLREKTSWFSRTSGEPVRLTHGPLKFYNPVPSRDGRQIFAVGEKERGELVRLDPRSGQFLPYLSGISATELDFSRDGQWVTYVTYPEANLWRSRVDGSDRLQLTRSPLYAGGARWSPDGKRLVFLGTVHYPKTSTYSISADGGLPELVPMPDDRTWVARSWSPDGGTLALGHRGDSATPIQLLELESRRFSKVPGSEGLFDPTWSPDGRHLAALSMDCLRLHLYDFASSRWRELLSGEQLLGGPAWSQDGRSLFVSEGSARIRLWIADGRREVVASFEGFRRPGGTGDWVGKAPDDSVITLRDLSVQEIFALDWDSP